MQVRADVGDDLFGRLAGHAPASPQHRHGGKFIDLETGDRHQRILDRAYGFQHPAYQRPSRIEVDRHGGQAVLVSLPSGRL